MKKIVSVFLTMLLLTPHMVQSSAHDVSIEEKRAYLVSIGYCSDFIESRGDEEIIDMYFEKYGRRVEHVTSETVNMSESNGGGDASAYGIIPESDMVLGIHVYCEFDYPGDVDRVTQFDVYVDYEWEEGHPAVTREDAITVNWDTSVFTYLQDSFYARDYKRLGISNGNWMVTKEYENPSEIDQGGLGYVATLSYATVASNGAVYQHKGSASFSLLPRENPMYLSDSGSVTSINVTYLHNKNPAIFTISFQHTSGLGISAEVSLLKDSVSKATNIRYSHTK